MLLLLVAAVVVFVLLLVCPSASLITQTHAPVYDGTAAEPFESKKSIVTLSTGEEETRASLERIFGKPFVKIRPPFLINPETGRRLELDCYNAELSIGVEFDGIQHSVYPNPFHRTQAEFEAQQRRDRHKDRMCKALGVRLLRVPHTIPRPQIEQFLRNNLKLAQ